jgi:hypothetical protein
MRTAVRFGLVAFGLAVPVLPVLGQELVSVQIIEPSCDTLRAQISVFFTFGAGSSCPPLIGFEILPGDATAILSLYYDISGPWPDLGCTTTTTVAVPIPSGEVMVHLGTFNIMEGDTSSMVADTLLHSCTTSIVERASNDLILSLQNGSLVWNALTGQGHGPIRILSGSGQLVRYCPVASGSCMIEDLQPGVYSAWWPGRGVFRFVLD